ncbi:hypothetical protein HKD37_18G050635 [Glycine soja]
MKGCETWAPSSAMTIVMQSYPARALDRRLQADWARDPWEGPRVLMILRVDFEPMGKGFCLVFRASSPSFLSKAHLGGEAPSSMAYSLMDDASSHLFSFVFRCISMTPLKLKDPASIEAPQASFHQVVSEHKSFKFFSEEDRSPPASRTCSPESVDPICSELISGKFDRCFTRPSTFLIQIYICLTFVFSSAFPNSFLRFTKSFQTLCFSMATSSKETAASGSPSVPSSPHQEQPELNIQPIQIIPGQASVPEKLVPRRPQGVKIAENPSPATSPREVDTEMDKKIRSIVSSILKDASVPEADEDVPTSSNPNVSVPDVKKDVPTSSAPNAEALPSPSEEGSTEEDDQAAEETPAPRAPEPAPGNLIDLEEVESDEEPIANRLAPGIAERLQSRKGKTPLKRSGRIKTMAQKKSTPITPGTSRRSKVAIPSKKRKEISSSDSDEDVELDVSTSKKAKTSGKKVPGNVPDAPLDNISFHSIGNAERWKFVYQRRLALERELGRTALDCKEIMDLIKAAGLLKTVSKLGDCYEGLVREFIVNIPSDISNRKSDDYQRVFVRGKCVRFSPAVINKYLGRPTDGVIDIDVSEHQIAKEITAKRVQHWPKKGKLSAGKLSVKYAILHRIGAANWVPTNHTSTIATGLGKFLYTVGTKSKFNFGNYIFDQTVKHSESFAVKLPIAFPTVLCGIMLSQHPNMLNYTDSVMKRESPLSLHYKLFEGTHVPDIVSTSVSTSGKAAASGAVSKDALIAELKDTCKVLEATIKATTEKKMELELLIKRLSENELSSLKLWKEKQERKEKGKKRVEEISQDERKKIREEERRKIMKEMKREKHVSYSSHNSCKSLSEELRDYYEGRHRVEQQLKKKSTSKSYGSHSYPKKDQGQGILGVTPSKPKDDKGKTIEKQAPKASMQEKTSSIKCFKCLGRGHITSQCPTTKTMIMRGQDIYSSQDEATTSPSSSESEKAKGEESSEEIYPQEEGQPLVVKEKCKEVSVSSKSLAKKETHFTIKTNIKETFPLRQPPHFLFCKKALASIATPLGLEFIRKVKKLLDEGLVHKSLNPCALLVPKIGVEGWSPEFEEPRDLRSNPFQGGRDDAILPRKGIG